MWLVRCACSSALLVGHFHLGVTKGIVDGQANASSRLVHAGSAQNLLGRCMTCVGMVVDVRGWRDGWCLDSWSWKGETGELLGDVSV